MSNIMLAFNTYLDYLKKFLLQERPFWGLIGWGSHMRLTSSLPCALCQWPKEGLTSTPKTSQAKIREDYTSLPQWGRASIITVNSTKYPPGYEMRIMAQEFCKLHEPKINKLKGGYSATVNPIVQSWLKDVRIHIEDWKLMQRELYS